MIAAVSFDLLPEASAHIEPWQTGVWMLIGVAVFLVADAIVENASAPREQARRWRSSSGQWWTASPNRRSSAFRSERDSR
jgi:hypothetical protein